MDHPRRVVYAAVMDKYIPNASFSKKPFPFNLTFQWLALGSFELNMQGISKLILAIDGWGMMCEIAFRRVSQDLTDDKWTLAQAKAWCRQASLGHYELIHRFPHKIAAISQTVGFKAFFKEILMG